MLIEGALVTVFVGIAGPKGADQDPGVLTVEAQAALFACAALAISMFWAWVAYRRRVLIGQWREQVLHLDRAVDRHGMYLRIEPAVGTYWWYGPTAFTATLPLLFVVGWSCVLLWLLPALSYAIPLVTAASYALVGAR